MQKRIVVLGGVGFIGSHLCRRLVEEGHELFAVDIRDVTNAPVLREVRRNTSFHYIHHNINHPFGIRCDEIYNLAAPSVVHYKKALPVETLRLYMLGSLHALDAARNERARLVFGSTGSLCRNQPSACNTPITTARVVSDGKCAAEALHRAYHAEFGVDTRIARIYNTYGSGADLMDQRVVIKLVVAALQNRELVIEGSGEQQRTFCWVGDVVDGLIRLMAAPSTSTPRVVNFGGDRAISIRALAELILSLTGSRSRIVHVEGRTEEVRRRLPDLTAAADELDWRPHTSIEEGLKQTIRYVEHILGQRSASYLSWVEINN